VVLLASVMLLAPLVLIAQLVHMPKNSTSWKK
jgi:hypothetical protein